MQHFFQNQSTSTTDKLGPLSSRVTDDYPLNVRVFVWGDFGAGGLVHLEILMPDGTWQDFPELIFETETARSIQLFQKCEVRFRTQDCVDVNILFVV